MISPLERRARNQFIGCFVFLIGLCLYGIGNWTYHALKGMGVPL